MPAASRCPLVLAATALSVLLGAPRFALAQSCVQDIDCEGDDRQCCLSSDKDPTLSETCVVASIIRLKNCVTSGGSSPTSAPDSPPPAGPADGDNSGGGSSSSAGGAPCTFDGSDPSDCVVKGSMGGVVVDWAPCSQQCLDALNLKVGGVGAQLS